MWKGRIFNFSFHLLSIYFLQHCWNFSSNHKRDSRTYSRLKIHSYIKSSIHKLKILKKNPVKLNEKRKCLNRIFENLIPSPCVTNKLTKEGTIESQEANFLATQKNNINSTPVAQKSKLEQNWNNPQHKNQVSAIKKVKEFQVSRNYIPA